MTIIDRLTGSQVCTDCGTERPIAQFPPDRRANSGRSRWCYPCRERTCVVCGRGFLIRTRGEATGCCSRACARARQLAVAGGCAACAFGGAPCDDHDSPPVCVCDHPTPDVIGECSGCLRPHKPFFADLREAWRTHLQGAA